MLEQSFARVLIMSGGLHARGGNRGRVQRVRTALLGGGVEGWRKAIKQRGPISAILTDQAWSILINTVIYKTFSCRNNAGNPERARYKAHLSRSNSQTGLVSYWLLADSVTKKLCTVVIFFSMSPSVCWSGTFGRVFLKPGIRERHDERHRILKFSDFRLESV